MLSFFNYITMRKTLFPAALLLVLCACGSDKKQIEQAAYGYLNAMGNYRFDEARPYATRQTCETTIDFFNSIMPHTDTAYIVSNTPAEITIKSVHKTSDTTAYALFHKSTPITQQDDTLQLVKSDGQWLANVVIVVPQIFNVDTTHHQRRITPEMAREMKRVPAGTPIPVKK